MSALTPPTQPTHQTVEHDHACIICGYNLRGLPASGLCPECGTPAERSLRGENLLVNSSPEYVASLHQGVFLILAAIIAMILGMFLFVGIIFVAGVTGGPGAGPVTLIGSLLSAGASIVLAYGWWRFTEPDPAFRLSDQGETPRKLVRAMVIVGAALTLLSLAVELLMGNSNAAPTGGSTGAAAALGIISLLITIVSFIVSAVQFFASMLYVRWLAPRVPNIKAFHRAKTLMWLGPLLYTIGALVVIGPLIALCLYWNMLDWIRKDIKQIRAEMSYG